MSVQRESPTEYGRHVISLDSVRSWPIIVGAGIVGEIGQHFDFSGYSCIVLIADTTVNKLYGEGVLKALEASGKRTLTVTLPAGERTKSLQAAERGERAIFIPPMNRWAIGRCPSGTRIPLSRTHVILGSFSWIFRIYLHVPEWWIKVPIFLDPC